MTSTVRVAVLMSAIAASWAAAPGGPDTQVTASIKVAYLPEFVAVNNRTDTIYVNGKNLVTVISGKTNAVVKTIRVLNGTGYLAVDPQTDRVYALRVSGVTGVSSVAIISGHTGKVVASIRLLGTQSWGRLAVNPVTNRIYVTQGTGSSRVAVINGQTDKVMTTIPVLDNPQASLRTRGPTASTWRKPAIQAPCW